MKRSIVIGIVIVVLVVILAVAAALFYKSGSTVPSGQNPFGGGTQSPTNTPTGYGLSVTSVDGEAFTIPDITQNRPSVTEPSGTYYQVTEDQNGQYQYSDFNIAYGSDSSFAIGLIEEPIGAAREHAEAKLRELTNLTDAQLCRLNVTVMVSPHVNEQYAGINLGLSFCPGAIKLP